MNERTRDNSAKGPESQPDDDALQTRIRIIMMRRRLRFLNQQYLAKKLRRSETAISLALGGERPQLLGRIKTHLDWLDRRDAQRVAA